MDLLRRILVRRTRLYSTPLRNYCAPVSGGASEEWPRRVVSGLQPTGWLHVGNYFGCVRRLVRLQDAGDDVTVFVADLHALTAAGGAGAALGERALQLGAQLLAAGLDPARCTLFVQSAVPRHAELCWVLACLATHARLAQLPQYRERAAAGADRLGTLLYPALQAADVLVYRATHVPVGADQLQHLQLAAQLVKTFHHRYGRGVFPTPQALLPEDGSRVRSLRAPERKMSKSESSGGAALLLLDSPAELARKLRRAVTDFTPQVTFEPAARPGVANLVTLHCLAADITPDEAVEQSDHLTTAQYKTVVSEAISTCLAPIRARALDLLRRPRVVRDALRSGAARARRRADRTWDAVAARVGLRAEGALHGEGAPRGEGTPPRAPADRPYVTPVERLRVTPSKETRSN